MIAAAAATIAFAALPMGACRRPPPAEETGAPRAAASAAAPVDRTAPGELAEGTEDAFGLKLPRYMRVTARFPNEIFAEGALAADRVTAYVKQRVEAKRVDRAGPKTVFSGATASGAPGKELRVEVLVRPGGTQLVVRDETRPVANDGLSPDDRMRAVGLKPDGTPIDQKHLE